MARHLSRMVSAPIQAVSWFSTWVVVLLCLSAPLHAKHYALIVSGLGGTPEYTESFNETATAFVSGLQTLEGDTDNVKVLDESATKDQILTAIAQISERVTTSDAHFSLVLIGHGTADGETWRFNIKGADLTTEDIVGALNALSTQRQLVVLAASASGAALDVLAQPQRVVITATKSGGESNVVRFPQFLSQALSDVSADYDRNEILTVAEAYRFAQSKTEGYYEEQNLLASEHARLKGETAKDTPLALMGSLRGASEDPVVAALLQQRLQLEIEFVQLKASKPDMSLASYYESLEALLLDISRLQQSIDNETGWVDSDAES